MRNEACHLSTFQHPVNLPVSLGDACLFWGWGWGSERTGVKTQFVGDALPENDKATWVGTDRSFEIKKNGED